MAWACSTIGGSGSGIVREDYPDAPRSPDTSRSKIGPKDGPNGRSVDPTSAVYCSGAGSLPDEVGFLPPLGGKPPRFSHGPST
jgi:hypothetical protein